MRYKNLLKTQISPLNSGAWEFKAVDRDLIEIERMLFDTLDEAERYKDLITYDKNDIPKREKDLIGKPRIKHSNNDIKRLHALARNGIIAHSTLKDILKNEVNGYIVFNSKMIYERFLHYRYTTLAFFN